jgi:hypothetical protein
MRSISSAAFAAASWLSAACAARAADALAAASLA